MNKQILFILVIFSSAFLLACFSSVAVLPGMVYPLTVPAAEVTALPTQTAMSAAVCAVVTAETAVHLRAGQGSDTRILAHLAHGRIVGVATQGAGWWLVTADGLRGYVRADYLEVVECEPS